MNPTEPANPELEPTQEPLLETTSDAPAHLETQTGLGSAPQVNAATAAPAPKIVGYCRECGKALDETNVRKAFGAIYCEEHQPAQRVAEHGAHPSLPPPLPYTAPAYHAGQSSYYASPPPASSAPLCAGGSPALAFILGMIPGVGAVYNGQYAKGLMHVVIFGLAVSLAHSGPSEFEPLFGLLIMGFWFYMAFEAYHTAKKRRAGLPLDEFSERIPAAG